MLDPINLEKQLQNRWANLPGVMQVRVCEARQGGYMILVDGTTKLPPAPITPTVRVNLGGIAPPRFVPVFWRQVTSRVHAPPMAQPRQMKPANEELWAGSTPTPDRPVDILPPYGHSAVGTQSPIPKPIGDEFQCALPARTLGEPAFWSFPLTTSDTICENQLQQTVTTVLLRLQDDEEAQLRNISYAVTGIPAGYQIQVSVVTNGGTAVATWNDMVVAASGNPAYQFALSGYLNPMPLIATIRHGQDLIVRFTILGVPPFNAPYTPLSATATILVDGWRSKINDTRDGAPRPIDIGDMGDVAFGMNDTLFKDIDPALVDSIHRYVNAQG